MGEACNVWGDVWETSIEMLVTATCCIRNMGMLAIRRSEKGTWECVYVKAIGV